MFKACVFDLDGTLIDSLRDLANSSNYAMRMQGYPEHDLQSYRFFVGSGVSKLLHDILPEEDRTPEIIQRSREYFNEYYDAHFQDNTAPYEGIKDMLERLKSKNFKLAVVSNKPNDFVRKIVYNIFKDGAFEVVFGQREGIPRKPDPAGVLEACKLMKVSPENCVYLGDSGIDMKTATAAGMYPVGVLWGFRGEGELMDNGAKALIKKPVELFDLLK